MAGDDYEAKVKHVAVIAKPLASEKLSKKLLKLCKKATKKKQVKRGVKEVVKAVRKNHKGCAAKVALSRDERLYSTMHVFMCGGAASAAGPSL